MWLILASCMHRYVHVYVYLLQWRVTYGVFGLICGSLGGHWVFWAVSRADMQITAGGSALCTRNVHKLIYISLSLSHPPSLPISHTSDLPLSQCQPQGVCPGLVYRKWPSTCGSQCPLLQCVQCRIHSPALDQNAVELKEKKHMYQNSLKA